MEIIANIISVWLIGVPIIAGLTVMTIKLIKWVMRQF